ncbi:cadherin domain-containing protein [Rubritalea tangerina]|uniref:Cadherin domain-containing protein n=1 Tax=Rubritalea tangerina TaxID=430798 RepID=A0ABW4Z7W9_9BACT
MMHTNPMGGSLMAASLFMLANCCLTAAPDTLTQSVTYNGETVTLRLTKQNLRGAAFEVLVQNNSGGYDPYTPVGERSYIGTVDEYPGAVSCGIQLDDGTFRGAVYFDRGATWFTQGSGVVSTRALGYSDFTNYQYPSAATVQAGQAGTTMYGFGLGIDADEAYYQAAGSSLATTMEGIEYSVCLTSAIYMKDVLLRPYLERVVIRTDAGQSPYTGTTQGDYLSATRTEWNSNHSSVNPDVVASVSPSKIGGGLAWVGVVGTSSKYSVNQSGSGGAFDVVFRHEMGHNWDLGHFIGGSPEGAGIMGGNQPARFSGCEAYRIFNHRDSRLQVMNTSENYVAVELPPYASMDTAAYVNERSGGLSLDVLANDHDANGQSINLVSFDATSSGGGNVVQNGNQLVYSAPEGFTGTDYFEYVIEDSVGKSATGVVIVDVLDSIDPVAVWRFDDAQDLTKASLGADLQLVGSHSVTAGYDGNDGAVRVGQGSHYVSAHGIVANGGGSKVNEYTLVYDLKAPSSSVDQWRALFQTDVANSDDGEAFFRPTTGTVGDSSTGYSGWSVPIDTWFRLVVSVDNDSFYRIYADGQQILSGSTQGIDGAYALEQTLILLGDNNGEDHDLDVSAIRIYDRALGASFVRALGSVESDQAPVLGDVVSTVSAGVPAGTGLYTVEASDANVSDALRYMITSGNQGGNFSIESETGVIRSSSVLAANAQYALTVSVVDDSGLSDSASIVLNSAADADSDGLIDAWEVTHFGAIASYDSDADADADGLSNGEEQSAGTVPTDTDSDDDGYADGPEVVRFSDPIDPQSSPIALYQGMVLDLQFDGDGLDASGYGHDATETGTASYTTGVVGQAASVASGQYFRVIGEGGMPEAMQLGDSSDFTVAFWVKAPNGWSGDPSFVSNKNWGSGNNTGWVIAGQTDASQYQWNYKAADSGRQDFESGGALADGQWHLVTVVHDRDGNASFYRDGVQVGQVASLGAGSIDSGLPLGIGADGNGNYQFNTTVYLDQVRMWTRALSLAEVQQLASGNDGNSPVANDTSGSVAEDATLGTTVATVSASDPDAGDSLSYAITAGNTGGAFAIDNSGVITTATALDYETTNSYTLTVTVTDNGGLSDTASVSVSVTDVLEVTAAVVATGSASNLAMTSADLGYSITDEGGEAPSVTLYYGETDGGTTPASWSNSVVLGTKNAGAHVESITGLNEGTSYYYTIAATNTAGTVWGSSASFTTVADTSPKMVRTTVSGVSSSSWTNVDLGKNYNSAVIVATPIYASAAQVPVVTRIRNVSGSSFEVKLDRADGLTAAVSCDVSVIAVEEGVYTLASDGVQMEAVKFTSTVTAAKSSWLAEARSYTNSYTTPVVLGQVMSANDANWSVFWSMGNTRTAPADASNLNIGKHVAEDSNKVRADETIGYIVIEAGTGSINGVAYEAGLGADTVRNTSNSAAGYSYGLTGLSSASAGALSSAAMDGGDGGWPVFFENDALSASAIKLIIDEDDIGDSESSHTTEQVNYLIFE